MDPLESLYIKEYNKLLKEKQMLLNEIASPLNFNADSASYGGQAQQNQQQPSVLPFKKPLAQKRMKGRMPEMQPGPQLEPNQVMVSAAGQKPEPVQAQQMMQPSDPTGGLVYQQVSQFEPGKEMGPMGQMGAMPIAGGKPQMPPMPQEGEKKLAQPQQGFKLTPGEEEGQHFLLTKYFDDPSTSLEEVPDKPSWANLLSAQSRYRGSEVAELMRKQRMV